MGFHTESMAVISTAHISKEDAVLIEEFIDAGKITGMSREEGWLIHTKPLRNEAKDGLPNLGYLLGYAAGKGCDWVLIDIEGDTLEEEELPILQ